NERYVARAREQLTPAAFAAAWAAGRALSEEEAVTHVLAEDRDREVGSGATRDVAEV
ncbi:MAG: hypothetical protein AVDCRST_MAG40-3234, partial [uncultured Gemmatimonadaceae bacterium]